MPANIWTEERKSFIRKHYPAHGAEWVAEKLGMKQSQVKAYASRNKIHRVNYRMSAENARFITDNIEKLSYKEMGGILKISTKQIKIFVYKRKLSPATWKPYTTEEDNFIIENYKHLSNTEMGVALDRSADSVRHRMRDFLLLYRTEEEIRLVSECNSAVRFKKGHVPHNTRYDGYVSTVFLSHTKPYNKIRMAAGKFDLLHRHNWELKYGPIPEGKILRAINGDTLNCDPDNWELIDRTTNLERNAGRVDLTDKFILRTLSPRDNDLQQTITAVAPELIDLKRAELKLRREINVQQS